MEPSPPPKASQPATAAAAPELPAALPATSTLWEQLVSLATNEARSLLQALAISADLFLERVAPAAGESEVTDPGALRQYGVTIRRQTIWLQRLVENLLYAARMAEGQLRMVRQAVPLTEIVDEVRPAIEPLLADTQQTLEVQSAAPLPIVQVDRQRLGQALMNLLLCVTAHAPAGVPIVLTIEPQPLARSFAAGRRQLPAAPRRRHGAQVRLALTAPGLHLPAESDPAHLFEPLAPEPAVRATGAGPGVAGPGVAGPAASGSLARSLRLGLAIARAIVEAHGGRAGVDARQGHDTRLWLELPAVAGEDAEPARARRRGATR